MTSNRGGCSPETLFRQRFDALRAPVESSRSPASRGAGGRPRGRRSSSERSSRQRPEHGSRGRAARAHGEATRGALRHGRGTRSTVTRSVAAAVTRATEATWTAAGSYGHGGGRGQRRENGGTGIGRRSRDSQRTRRACRRARGRAKDGGVAKTIFGDRR